MENFCNYFIMVFLYLLFQIKISVLGHTSGIGCYVCSSFNGSDPLCHDPFNTIQERAANFYSQRCMGYRKDRSGYFPADHCIKIKGTSDKTPKQQILIRTCSLDSGTLTADTEIVRMSHCGHFMYNGQYFSGCVQSCDLNGCNHASKNCVTYFKRTFLGVICLLAIIMQLWRT